MKVLMLSYQFHPVIGGAERQCQTLSEALKEEGVDVRVATFRVRRDSPWREVVGTVPVRRLPRLVPAESNLAVWMLYLGAVARRYDILHVHEASQAATVAAFLAGKMFHRPVVVKFTNSGALFDLHDPRRRKRWPLRAWIRRSVLAADALIATSRTMENDILATGASRARTFLIPNGVLHKGRPDQTLRDRRRKELNLRKDDVVILRVGRLEPAKGVEVLLDAWSAVRAKCPRAIMVSVGGKSIPAGLKEKIGAAGSGVIFHTERPGGVLPFLEAADIFVLPSFAEGLSNALLEAQSAGLPAVATRVGGNTDVVKDGVNGILVDPGDSSSLAEALARLAGSHADRRRMGEGAVAAVESFDIGKITKRYLELYERLLSGRAQ